MLEPKIVSVSGLDGAGKSTLARSLVHSLGLANIQAEYCAPLKEIPRDILLSLQMGGSEVYLAHLVDALKGVLYARQGVDVLVCDRYRVDFMVTQLAAFGGDFQEVTSAFESLPRESSAIFLKLSPEDALERILKRGSPSPLETSQILKNKCEAYERLFLHTPHYQISALHDQSSVLSQSLDHVRRDLEM